MTASPSGYDVTITVDRHRGRRLHPAEFAAAAEQAASARPATVMSAHTADKIISIVTVQAADRPVTAAIALAAVSEAVRSPAA